MLGRFLLLAGLLALLLTGCGDDTGTAPVKGNQSNKSSAKKSAAEKPVVEEVEEEIVAEYRYNPIGKRDPFMSPLAMLGGVDGDDSPITPLQRYDVNQFRLNGVILGLDSPSAMVMSPDGKSYILKVGTKIGKNGGKVVQITNEGVSVEEVLVDFSGEKRVNVVLIALPKRKGA